MVTAAILASRSPAALQHQLLCGFRQKRKGKDRETKKKIAGNKGRGMNRERRVKDVASGGGAVCDAAAHVGLLGVTALAAPSWKSRNERWDVQTLVTTASRVCTKHIPPTQTLSTP